MGKASRSKRERRAAGVKRVRGPVAEAPAAEPLGMVKHGVCRACGDRGFIATGTNVCTGYAEVPRRQLFRRATSSGSRAAACLKRVARRAERSL